MIRLFVSNNSTNSSAFYFNAITVTAAASASTTYETAFLLNSSATTVTVYLQVSTACGSSSVRVFRNANGSNWTTAAQVGSTSTQTIASPYTVYTYTFTGLTLNQFDSIHINFAPSSRPDNTYAIVIVQ